MLGVINVLAAYCYNISMSDADEKKKNTRYLRGKDGFKIEATDPIQDIMSDDELSEAEKRINSLIDEDNDDEK